MSRGFLKDSYKSNSWRFGSADKKNDEAVVSYQIRYIAMEGTLTIYLEYGFSCVRVIVTILHYEV